MKIWIIQDSIKKLTGYTETLDTFLIALEDDKDLLLIDSKSKTVQDNVKLSESIYTNTIKWLSNLLLEKSTNNNKLDYKKFKSNLNRLVYDLDYKYLNDVMELLVNTEHKFRSAWYIKSEKYWDYYIFQAIKFKENKDWIAIYEDIENWAFYLRLDSNTKIFENIELTSITTTESIESIESVLSKEWVEISEEDRKKN